MIELKQLHEDSICQIIEFDKTCFPTDHWIENDWKELLADPRAIYYALLDRNNIVGNIFVYNWKGEKDYIKIMNIAVCEDYRKQGLAHRMLNYVSAEMSKLDMRRFCGETRASNKAMRKTFEGCGYVLSTIEEGYYDNPTEGAYKYVLEL